MSMRRRCVLLLSLCFFFVGMADKGKGRTPKEGKGWLRWERMVRAIAEVESGTDDQAYNPSSGALGRYQMKKIYVDEVNCILKLRKKKLRFKYEDRKDPRKARTMFEIYQSRHNKKRDILRAIDIHRGKISYPYRKEVNKLME